MSDNSPLIPSPAPRVPTGAWGSVLEGGHPRLLGPRGFLQSRVAKYPELYAEIRHVDSLFARGVVEAVEGLREEEIQHHIGAAKEVVARGITNVHQDTWIWMMNIALTFDFFFDHIAPEDRQAMIDWINPHLETFKDDENAFHNSLLSKVWCYLRIAYAMWRENPRAREFRDYALRFLYEERLVPVLREFGAGGGYTECGWYQRSCVWNLIEALELARRVEGYDGFQQAPRFYYQRLAYEMLHPYPRGNPDGTERFAMEGDGTEWYSPRVENTHLLRDVLAEYFHGSELSRSMANCQRWARHPLTKTDELLWRPEMDQYPLPLEEFPLAHLAAGVGKVFARGDWTPDATWFRFECGDYWNAHQHLEVGNFEIFRRETLASEAGRYDWGSPHAVNYYLRTIAHNCVLVHRPGETWERLRDGGHHAPYANDGGQAKKWTWPVPTLPEWKAAEETFRRGEIIGYQNERPYLFLAADCTRAYDARKLELWRRQIVFVRPHRFVIFDRVVSTKPEYRKTWLLHSRFEPQLAGNGVSGRHSRDLPADCFLIRNGAGELFGQRLLPAAARVSAVEGYDYDGRELEPELSHPGGPDNRWRIEACPRTAQCEDLFLHVLSTDGPVRAELMCDDDTVGVRFGETEVRFTGRAGGALRVGGEEHPLLAEVRRGRYE